MPANGAVHYLKHPPNRATSMMLIKGEREGERPTVGGGCTQGRPERQAEAAAAGCKATAGGSPQPHQNELALLQACAHPVRLHRSQACAASRRERTAMGGGHQSCSRTHVVVCLQTRFHGVEMANASSGQPSGPLGAWRAFKQGGSSDKNTSRAGASHAAVPTVGPQRNCRVAAKLGIADTWVTMCSSVWDSIARIS